MYHAFLFRLKLLFRHFLQRADDHITHAGHVLGGERQRHVVGEEPLGLRGEFVVAGPEDEPDGEAGEDGEVIGCVALVVGDSAERFAGFFKGLKRVPEAEGQARPAAALKVLEKE